MFKPFADEQLQEMEDRFGPIYVHRPKPAPKSRWAKADAPDPPPAFEIVFRACTPGEWSNIRAQLKDPKREAGAAENLGLATIIAVSIDGKHTIHAGATGSPPNDRAMCKPAREALEDLIRRPGNAAVLDGLGDLLAAHNGAVREQEEKG